MLNEGVAKVSGWQLQEALVVEPPYPVGVLVLQVGNHELGPVHSPRQPGGIARDT